MLYDSEMPFFIQNVVFRKIIINFSLRRFTIRAHTVNPIDNLTYLYDDFNKNLLRRVIDATANQDGFKRRYNRFGYK